MQQRPFNFRLGDLLLGVTSSTPLSGLGSRALPLADSLWQCLGSAEVLELRTNDNLIWMMFNPVLVKFCACRLAAGRGWRRASAKIKVTTSGLGLWSSLKTPPSLPTLSSKRSDKFPCQLSFLPMGVL